MPSRLRAELRSSCAECCMIDKCVLLILNLALLLIG
jgi:hypothetical protein